MSFRLYGHSYMSGAHMLAVHLYLSCNIILTQNLDCGTAWQTPRAQTLDPRPRERAAVTPLKPYEG